MRNRRVGPLLGNDGRCRDDDVLAPVILDEVEVLQRTDHILCLDGCDISQLFDADLVAALPLDQHLQDAWQASARTLPYQRSGIYTVLGCTHSAYCERHSRPTVPTQSASCSNIIGLLCQHSLLPVATQCASCMNTPSFL
jgi:hypothetical protein